MIQLAIMLAIMYKKGYFVSYMIHYGAVAEWLKALDCKSNLFGVRGFESLSSHNDSMSERLGVWLQTLLHWFESSWNLKFRNLGG